MIPVWFNCGRGVWDTGLIEAAISGDLWPLPVGFEVVDEPRSGGIAVIHGEYALAHPRPIPERMLIIHGGDENRQWTPPKGENLVWSQHAKPGQWQPHRKVVPGCPPDTRSLMRDMPRGPLSERRLWGFAGQAANDSRKAFLTAVSDQGGGECHVSPSFGQGLERTDYLRFLCQTAIAPSPAGSVDPEGFRLYEAIEAGCLPVAQRSCPGWEAGFDWWRWTLGEEPPFPVVDHWHEAPGLFGCYASAALRMQLSANLTGWWWQNYKRRYALNLLEDLATLGAGSGARLPGLGSDVTVIISSSPIQGHPSTALLENTIRSIRSYPELAACEILLCLDGYPMSADPGCSPEAYEEYRRRVLELCSSGPGFRGCLPIVFEGHTHQAEMTRFALRFVRTPLIFFVEHDTYPFGAVDFAGIARVLLETEEAGVIRLSIWHDVLDEHLYLYPEGRSRREVLGVPLIRTVDWSQRPHLARTEFYRALLADYVAPGQRIWIEHALYGPAVANPWEKFRICVYAPAGDMTRSGHSDGRRWVAA